MTALLAFIVCLILGFVLTLAGVSILAVIGLCALVGLAIGMAGAL